MSSKKKSWESEGNYADVESAGAFFSSQCNDSSAKMGVRGAYVGTESEKAVIGIPLEAFSQQLLFRNNVFPLGRMTMLIAESDVGKTALQYEIARWHMSVPGGGFIYILNEGRDTPDLRASIIGHELINSSAFQREPRDGPCVSLQQWQRILTGWLQRFEEKFKKDRCAFPVCIGLDSLTGTTSENVIEKIEEEGCAPLTFPQDAALINTYSKFVHNRLYSWPISLVGTNHLKYDTDRYGNKKARAPGGFSLLYNATFIIHMVREKTIDRLDVAGGRRVKIMTNKNLGDHSSISVEYSWVYENGLQHTTWQWHAASVECLLGWSGERRKKLEELIEFPNVDKVRRTCTCPQLGIKKSTSYDEVGRALMQSADVLKALQDYFGINRRPVFRPNVPFSRQVQEAVAAGHVEKIQPEASVYESRKEEVENA